ncbi:MAG: hypothetical protein FJ100_06255 [Deltaproteobacteria bacterium]|nr:hypothetical protein [Deltaproteobacteria bacterium]
MATERPGEVAARSEFVARIYAQLGYAAVNVGAHELAAGLGELRRFGKLAKLQLLSANLRDAKTGAPAFDRYLVRQVGPLKVAVVGVVSAALADRGRLIDGQGLDVVDPIAVLQDLVPTLRKQGAELVVVLSQLRRNEIESLAHRVPAVDLVLGSMDMELTLQPLTVGKQALWVDAYTKGKYVVDVAISVRGNRDRFLAANLRDAKLTERADAARQLQDLTAQLDDADRPGGALQLTAETRAAMEAQRTAARARLQRLTHEVENADTHVPADASTVEVLAAALATSVADDPAIDKQVKAFQVKYPKLPGH